MHIHESAFWGSVCFLIGVFLSSSMTMGGVAVVTVLAMGALGVYGWRTKKKWCTYALLLSVLLLVGALYASGYNVIQKNKTNPLIGRKITEEVDVIEVRQMEKVQQIRVRLRAPHEGIVAVTARAYPQLAYGDVVRVSGKVNRPSKENMQYLIKDAVFASMEFPDIELRERNAGNAVKQKLLQIRKTIVATYERVLGSDEAALLAGITIGERASFDKEFVKQMKQSGTTHLVALSGYNISIVAIMILGVAGWIVQGAARFWIALGAITLFVVMAGAEASAVRAAIMGSIVLLAQYLGRAHSMRNAIAVSALVMVLWNPNALRFDLGFQLSFMALIGIVYVKPHMDKLIKRGKNGLLDWRENLSGTTAAQLAVFPILMHQIGSFSIVAILSNILVLTFIPMTMGFGFIVGALGFVSISLASFVAMIAAVLLQYEIGIIRFFGAYSGLSFGMGMGTVILYYLTGGWLVLYLEKKRKSEEL